MRNFNDPMFIAEVSANHLGSLERAKKIVEAASSAGATAVKFQTYTADTMTIDIPSFTISNEHELWGGKNLYQLYKEAYTPWDWHEELFDYARNLGLIPFSTPFDLTAINFLEKLNAPLYKIASMETGDHRLIRAAAETGKPIIVSTGATEFHEIQEIVKIVRETGNSDLTLLVCTSSYPSKPEDSHVSRIKTLREEFGCSVGLSDHTLGIGASIAAITFGATAIEKHLTLRRADGGADAAFSMEPAEFGELVTQGKIAKLSIGSPEWKIQASERESRRLRRSLYVIQRVEKGEIVSLENVGAIRPGGGGAPRDLPLMLGKRFLKDCEPGTPLTLDILGN